MTTAETDQRTPLLWTDKRFHTWNYEMRETFGTKIFKVMLDAGFTCPNRDGSIAAGGCTFCSTRGSGDFAGSRRDVTPLGPETPERYQELADAVDAHCPVLDLFTNATPVERRLAVAAS